MKQTLLVILCSVLFVACASASEHPTVQADSYSWTWDMFVYFYDSVILAIVSPFFFFASLFGNCQSCYVDFLTTFVAKKGFRFSYKYV